MKKVLITGVNSYVGTNLKKWLDKTPEHYDVDLISMRDGSWREKELSSYDSIVHVAGIAHVSTDPKMEEQYYKVNRDLTIEIARKAKLASVNQFIFLSSIIVYGDHIGNGGVITKDTIPQPANFYGKSKLEAEQGIMLLEDETFNVVVIRPPMIYGKESKGNYPRLANFAKKSPLFPNIPNKRSMLHVDNLSEFLRLMIVNNESGLFFPQNKEYVNTSEMVKLIAEVHGRKIITTKIFNPLLRILIKRIGTLNKVFGDLIYLKEISEYKIAYQKRNLKESIQATELKNGN